jgi:hypothetical protein
MKCAPLFSPKMISTTINIISVDHPSSDMVLLRLAELNMTKYSRSAAMTDIVVIYDVNDVVGGAFIRCTPKMVTVRQMCTLNDVHSVAIVDFLIQKFDGIEIHLNVLCTTMHLYTNLDFVKRYRSRNCLCSNTKNISHITRVQKPPVVAAKGITFYVLNLNLKMNFL